MKHSFELFQNAYGTEDMRSVWKESSMVQKWLDVEAAIAAAQKELGLLTPEIAERIIECCDVSRIPPSLIAKHKASVDHVMVATMHAFKEVCGPAGEMLHLGATTQDVLDTGMVLQIQQACRLIRQSLAQLDQTLLGLADRHKHSVMMGRTHAQHATPVTFGFKVVIWASELADHQRRLDACMERIEYSSLSGSVGSNASYQQLLGPEKIEQFHEIVASRLQLKVSVLDLHQRVDRFVELVHVLAMIGTTLGRIGLEIRELQRPEIGELEEPLVLENQYASSTMPNKRNPNLCEWQAALAKLLRANSSAIGEVTMQHERDGTWLAVGMAVIPESFLLCASALNMANTVMAGLTVHSERMRRNLYVQHGVAMAESAMLRLYSRFGKKLEAHRICYEAAMKAFEEERPLSETLLEHPELAGHVSASDLESALNPETYTGNCAKQVDAYCASRR